ALHSVAGAQANSSTASEEAKGLRALESLDAFIQSMNDQQATYYLNLEQVEQLALGESASSLLAAASKHIQAETQGPQAPLERLEWSERKAQLQLEARALVMQIF